MKVDDEVVRRRYIVLIQLLGAPEADGETFAAVLGPSSSQHPLEHFGRR
jgi:hypothetical protein